MEKKKVDRDYTVDFSPKPITQRGATTQKVALDSEFVEWVFTNVSPSIELSSSINNVNICQRCINKYRSKDKVTKNKQSTQKSATNVTTMVIEEVNCIDSISTALPLSPLPIETSCPISDVLPMPTSNLRYITLGCFDKFRQPRTKIDGAIDIPYDLDNLSTFGQIEEEILSHTLPAEWECKKRKNIQLCVYSTKQTKRKQIHGSTVIDDDEVDESVQKKTRTSESDSSDSPLHAIKLEIFENLPKCEYHVQGCLISEDGCHLKLNNDMITIWARAVIAKISGVDTTNPPSTKIFDRINYRYPNSKKPLENYHNKDNILFIDDPISAPIQNASPKNVKPNLATIHLKKKSPYKSNIQITKGMTFQDLIRFVFLSGPPEGKRFVTKSSLDTDGKVFLSEQMIEEVFFELHIHLWIDIEKTLVNFDELFDDNE
ncbi:unnamed protein product [Rhizophagus irregularis]|uniref:Uncharacterized protein n=1 Tax=Rhizophagus irregularis TaxID=588596 RepID=A0A915Z1R4_9GLOM|nr:unnamed protein product [Rhizophagus irregularis]